MFTKAFKSSTRTSGFFDAVDTTTINGSFRRLPYICNPFVRKAFDIDTSSVTRIVVSLSPVSPRRKGWKKIRLQRRWNENSAYKDVFVSEKECDSIDAQQQSMLRRLGMGSCFWMKITPV